MHVKTKKLTEFNEILGQDVEKIISWQFIITTYSSEKKRGVQKVAGTFKADKILSEIAIDDFIKKVEEKGIVEHEVSQINEFLREEFKLRNDEYQRTLVGNTATRLSYIVDCIKGADVNHLSQELTDDLYAQMDALKVALREQGFVKPRKKK